MEVSRFLRTTAINKLLAMKARKKVVQGSTSAGKTYGIIPVLIDRAAKTDRLRITVVAETLPSVKEGAVEIFKSVMQDTFRWNESRWNASSLKYTFANKSYIIFKSFDSVGKAKATGKRDILFINEANHIKYEIADTLMIRHKEVWIDYNPDHEFWAHTEVLTEPNSEFLLLTYLDNEACPEETIEDLNIKMTKAFYDPSGEWADKIKNSSGTLVENPNIKSFYWANWCRVYVRGEVGTMEGTILQNWKTVEGVPPGAELTGYGVDFGKGGPDPTTTVAIYRYDGMIYIDELIYQSGLLTSDHVKLLKAAGVNPKLPMYCDNAEPSKIKELQNAGFNASGPKKETIAYGIDLMQEYTLRVTARSLNLIGELRKWKWSDKNKTMPIDAFNHCIDAIRYFFVGKWGANASGKVTYNRRKRK
jgi:phage terminase large subunit